MKVSLKGSGLFLNRFLVVGASAFASVRDVRGELIPTPDFSNHPIPTSTLPEASTPWWEWIDVAVLVLALGLASYAALRLRSRAGLFAISIASLGYFGFFRNGCVCSIGSIQNVVLGLFDSGYVVPLSVVAFFALPLLFTLFFGRTFCAGVCPLGAIQEVVSIKNVQVPKWLDHSLGLLAWVYLGAAVIFAASGTTFLICRYDPFVGFFRLGGNANMMIAGGILLAIGVFVGRPYCRYLCPYGAVLSVFSRFSKTHLRIPPSQCITCGLCADACPYGAIDPPVSAASPQEARYGRRRLGRLLLIAPILVIAFGGLGYSMRSFLSKLDPQIQLAEQLRLESLGLTEETTDASEAFRNAQRDPMLLYSEMIPKRAQFGRLGMWLGVWVGLVVSVKLIALATRRPQPDYRANPSQCVSCGRCFWYCPVQENSVQEKSPAGNGPASNTHLSPTPELVQLS